MIRDVPIHRRIAAAVLSVPLVVLAAPLLLVNRLRRRSAEPKRILLLELWGIGDVVLATGALRSIRTAYPTARISVLAKSFARELLIAPGLADEVIAYDFPWTAFTRKYHPSRYDVGEIVRLIRRLRRERFDLLLNGRADPRNNLLAALTGAGRSVSLASGVADFLVTDVVHPERDAHRTDDWRMIVERATGRTASNVLPSLTSDENALSVMRKVLSIDASDHRRQLVIGIHPGARIAIRRWELARFARVADTLVDRLDARIVVFAEPDGYGANLPMKRPYRVVERSLVDMTAAFTLCDAVICNDSGPMHVANAAGVPVVALFGPTKLEWFGPRGAPSRAVRVAEMPCRPCFDVCKFMETHCMTRISENEVVEATIDLLAERFPGAVSAVPLVRAARDRFVPAASVP